MMGHFTSSTDAAGICLNFSQACQNKMFSALTSDFKKACRERYGVNTNTSGHINRQLQRGTHCSLWSGGHRRDPPAASQMKQPSSGHWWLSPCLRQECLEDLSYCLQHQVLSICSTLRNNHHRKAPVGHFTQTDCTLKHIHHLGEIMLVYIYLHLTVPGSGNRERRSVRQIISLMHDLLGIKPNVNILKCL